MNGPSIVIATNGKGTIQITGDDSTKKIDTGYVFFVAPGSSIELTADSANQDQDFTTYRAFVEA